MLTAFPSLPPPGTDELPPSPSAELLTEREDSCKQGDRCALQRERCEGGESFFFQEKPSLSFKKLELEEEEEEHGRMDGVRVGSGLTGESPKKLPPFLPPPQFFTPPPSSVSLRNHALFVWQRSPFPLYYGRVYFFVHFFCPPLPRPSAAGSFPLHPGKELLELLTRNEVQQRTTTVFYSSSSPSQYLGGRKRAKKRRRQTPFSVRRDGPPYCVHKAFRDSGSFFSATFNLGRRRASPLAVVSFNFFFAGGQFFCQVDFWRQTLWRRQRYKTRESRRASIFPPPLSPFFARRCTYVLETPCLNPRHRRLPQNGKLRSP